MGKQRNRRYKFHLSTNSGKDVKNELSTEKTSEKLPIEAKNNIFEGLDISSLFNNSPKADDLISVKSYISSKSLKGEKVLPKKEKLKLRREIFLKKIDTVNQLKKEQNERSKKRKQSVIGDTKSLLDNLPSLESLYKFKDKEKIQHDIMKVPKKKKAIEKSKKSPKKIIQNISIYKKLLKNPMLVKNPFEVISDHLKAVVEQERDSVKKLPLK